ncbi:ASCH domain-containing protein [Bacillus salipaludis]
MLKWKNNLCKEEMMMTENNALPPKTCTIDRMITVAEDVQKVLSGEKTATRRNGRYADPGEIMTLEGRQFVVEKVYSQSLGELTDDDARREGFNSLEDYKQSILSMHPGMPWLPQMRVWVHEFRPAE